MFYPLWNRRAAAIAAFIWAAFLCLPGLASGSTLDDWREEIGDVRKLAENDTAVAYKEAQRLQAGQPVDATPADKARVLNLLARIETYMALVGESEKHARLALDIAERNGDKEGQVEALLNTVLISINRANFDKLVEVSSRSVELLHDVDRPDLLGEAMLQLSMMYRRHGQEDASVAVAVQALEIAKRSNNPLVLAYAHQGLGISFDLSGRNQEARRHYLQMRDYARAANSKRLEAHANLGLGMQEDYLGNHAEAERLMREAVAMFRAIGMPFSVSHGLYGLADSYSRRNMHAEAAPILDEIVASYAKYPNPAGLWYALNARSANLQALGRVAAARADAQQAYALAEKIGIFAYRSTSARRMAAIATADGDYRRAADYYAEAIEMADKADREKDSTNLLKLVQHYETDSQQRQFEELSRRNERLWMVLGSGLAILSITTLFLFRLRRSRNEIRILNAALERRMDELLKKRETEFRTLIENAVDPIYRYDRHCRHTYVNPAVERITGRAASILLGRTPAETPLMPAAESVGLQQSIQRVLDTGVQDEIEVRFEAPDGVEFYFQHILAPEFSPDGSVEGVLSIGRDVTARKRMEDVLFDSERKYRSLAENSPDNIARYDRECRLRYLNRNLETTLGVDAGAGLGETPTESFGKQLDDYEAALRRVLATGEQTDCYLTLPDCGDGVRYHHVRMTPERDEGGEVAGVLAIGRDITERKLMERQLELKEYVLDHARESVYLVDLADLSFVYVNEEACRALGYGREELMALSLHEIDIDLTPETGKALWDKVLANGSHTFETRHRRRDGSFFQVEVQGSMVEYGGRMLSLSMVRDITERKLMESELRLKEFVLDQARIGVYLIGDDARITYVNDAACRALGYSREELLTKTTMDINVDSSVEASMSVHRKVLDEGFCTFETQHVRRDGSLLPVEVWASMQEYQGKAIGMALALDITERKRMEDELRAREHEFRTLAASLPDNIVRYNREGVTVYVNPVLERTLGDLATAMIGTTPREYHPDGSYEDYARLLDAVLASGEAGELEKMLPGPDGETTIHQIRMVPEYGANGEIVGVLAIGRDITERKRMEAELAASVRDFRSLAENIPDNVARWDAAGRFLYSNPTHQRTLGKLFDEMVGRTISEVFPDGHFASFEEALASVVATGTEVHLSRVMARTPDGGMVIHDVRLTPEFDAGGRVVSVLGLGRDMTDIYRMQEALVAREREFRSLAENSPDNIVRWDVEGHYLYLNPAHERTLGVSAGDIIGKRISASHPHVKAGIAHVAETGQSRLLVRQSVVVDGKLQIHEVRLAPERDADGRIVGVLGLGRDMTDIYRMQEIIVAREREFRSLAENSPDNIARYDCALRLTFLNPALATSLQVPADEVIGKHLLEAFPGEDFRALADKLIQTMQCGIVADFPIVIRDRGDGERIHHLRIAPERDKLGEVVGALVIGRDMTDIFRMQEAIAARERELRALAESSPGMMGAFYARPDGTMCMPYVSAKIQELFGLHPQEVRDDATPLLARTHPDDAERVGETIAESARNMTTWHEQYRIIHPERGELWMESHTNPEPHPDGGVVWYGYVHDITGRKQVERELAELHVQLRGLIAQREDVREDERKYIARELHDELGQLLTGLKLKLAIVAHKFGEESPALREHLDENIELVKTTMGVVRNMSMALRPVELDMGIVPALEWMVERFATFTNVECGIHIEDKNIRLDESRSVTLFRIVQESLTNVARYAQATEVRIDFGKDADDYVLKVRDNGIGFDTSAKKANSFGLVGIRERALMLNGSVIITSATGQGTEILVRIPAGEKQ